MRRYALGLSDESEHEEIGPGSAVGLADAGRGVVSGGGAGCGD